MASKTHLTIACAFLLAASLSVAAEDGPFDAEQTYKATCFACHGTGAAHSPEVGDQIEWEIRHGKRHGHTRSKHDRRAQWHHAAARPVRNLQR